jgi:hypothetical protein
MNLETTISRGRPRNRWQDEVREDERIVGVEEWQEKVYDREESKKILRTARNRRILHMPLEKIEFMMSLLHVLASTSLSPRRMYTKEHRLSKMCRISACVKSKYNITD